MIAQFYWRRAAVIAPTVALCILILLDFLDFRDLKHRAVIVIVSGFLTTAVIWWWWVMDQIHTISKLQEKNLTDFITVKEYIKETKELVREEKMSSTRQRRKPKVSKSN